MSYTAKLIRGWSYAGSDGLGQEEDVTAGSLVGLDEPVPDGSVDLAVLCAIDLSQLKALYIEADQDITLETNAAGGSSGAPDDTLELTADVPKLWSISDGLGICPLTADVDTFFVTNGSGENTTLKLRALVDPTV